MIRYAALLMLLIATAGHSLMAQTPTATPKLNDQFARLSDEWMQALKDHDMKTLESLMADDYTLAFASQVKEVPRADWLRTAGNMQTKSFSYNHLKVHHYGKSLAVVNAVFLNDSELNGKPRAGAITSVSDVWEKRNGKWQVVTRYATRPEEIRGPGSAGFNRPAAEIPGQNEELAKLSNVWMQAAMDHDTKTLESLTAKNFTLVHPSLDSVVPRADWLRDLANTKTKRFDYRHLKVHNHGESLAVVNAAFLVEAEMNGQPSRTVTSVTDVWEKRHGKWQVVTRYETRSQDLPAPAAVAPPTK